ncbi:MAG: putative type 4 fimbrial biogenesis pily1-related protein signal peptide [Candidatus Gallionella acididurans]|uniref:Putative type 4 fimbrial biogenesis pily1-related protein signal peptide n=1 Tax=Candidatus Gallionella acididurans TaxID=1796491 RepID=A0A139BPS1_9PROT|nr:MAG: putative type 4 fimbrial biogenesis pily1-related protein signal peptide [Candidatus Gallionella acididurans]
MKTMQLILTALLGALLLNSAPIHAQDIDIYTGLAGTANIPNVMFVVDNPSSQNNNVGPCTYWDGTIPSQGSSALGNDQCALANIVHGLSTSSTGTALVNMGFTTMDGVIFPLTPVDDNTYTGPASGTFATSNISYTIPSGSTDRQAIIIVIKAINQTTGKSGQGAELQETWAYYTGGNGSPTGTGMLSGISYPGVNTSTSCNKDYLIYLSNVHASAAHAQDDGEYPAPYLTQAVNNAVALNTITSSQGSVLLTALPTITGEAGWGREWARFMYNNDSSVAAAGVQGLITYSVATGDTAVPPSAITNSMELYISQVANYGGGRYFPAGTSYSALYEDILKILNEVQAVNSVFASSSLPVSVNAQGTYLNQIYMGMFRPDPMGLPRWVGNLKQYQFCYDTTTQSLYLCDSLGQPAISGAGTGFISANAVSFWTTQNLSVQPDLGGGFWRNEPRGVGMGYDLPDGELVEKGGAAQQLRLANLLDNYTSNPSSPRNVYTYCPSGSSCVAALSNSANSFSTTNVNITASQFGSSNIPVQSIVRSGTTALVTTYVAHGYSTGDTVTISGAIPNNYDVTQSVTVNSATTFTLTGLPDWPTTPNAGTYVVALHNNGQAISSITRSSSATASGTFASGCTPNLNCETATVTTTSANSFAVGNNVTISGATPYNYNGSQIITTAPNSTTFTYSIPIHPTTPAANSYTAVEHAYSANISTISKVTGKLTVTTSAAHGFHAGEAITISGNSVSAFNGSWSVVAVLSSTSFTLNSTSNSSGTGGTASPSTTPVGITGLSRAVTTVSATATATGLPASYFANGDLVDITTTGTIPNESAYVQNAVQITCTPTSSTNPACSGTTFTYPVTVTPILSAEGTMTVSLSSSSSASIPAGSITRSGTTATVSGVSNAFVSGNIVDIFTSGTVYSTESAYVGTWTITCPSSCSSAFTFGPVTLTPTSPATGTITAYSGTAPPNETLLVNWARGQDNNYDEPSPDPTFTTINIRPSVHGDVLHSRPTVINYGGTTGVVVYYGANDGVFRAVNGNQTNPAGSALPAPGSELWSFIPTELYSKITRLHDNSPVLLLANTTPGITPAPRLKDYFVDGTSTAYQKLNSDGTINTAYLYLSMRRGGYSIYGLDVSSPTSPNFLWQINNQNPDFVELGQTWSAPKVAFINGYCGGLTCSSTNLPTPVLIFGAGYDSAEDIEPPAVDASGRGIFIVDAITGNMIWRATYGTASGCSGTTIKASCTVLNMNYSIPSDITLMDIDNDGYVDRLYAVDTGGNIWRVDLEPTAGNTPNYWQVTQLAALGCNSGPCAAGTTPRKFLFPADMVPATTYDAVLVGSGDREHPLYSNLSYNVVNRFYMVKDPNVGNNGSNLVYTEANLTNITPVPPSTTTSYNGLLNGYYLTLGTGEKCVNAPVTVAGYTYFGTNTPATPTSNSCSANLGIAKGYQISPLTGVSNSTVYAGGGLPPTAVAGLVTVNVNGTNEVLPFCIGCGGSPTCVGADCNTAIGGGKPQISVPTSRSRTYWYKESD